MDEILKKANELGHLLQRHEIVTRFRELSQKLENSDESRGLLEDFAHASQQYQRKEQAGQPIEPSEKQKLQEMEEKVRADSLIAEFLATESYYLALLGQVNEAIANPTGQPPASSNIILPNQDSGLIMP